MRAEHALRALVELASCDDALVSSSELALRQDIPHEHLEAVMTELRRSGLVRCQRGPDGGFSLARPAAAISLQDIVSATGSSPSLPG